MYGTPAGDLNLPAARCGNAERLQELNETLSADAYFRKYHVLARWLHRKLDTAFGTLQRNMERAQHWRELPDLALVTATNFLEAKNLYAELETRKRW